MDEEDFLAAVEADNINAPVAEPKEEETPAAAKQEPEQPASAEVAPVEPTPTEQPAVVPEAAKHQPDPGFVPIGVVLDTRDKLKAAEERAARAEALIQQQQAQTQVPDRYEDPEGFEAYQESRIQQALVNQNLNVSERFARKEHGAETVDAAKTWAMQTYPQGHPFWQQVLADADPYEQVVTSYKRDQLFSKVTDPSDFDAFLAWKAAQGQLQQQAAPAAPPNPAPAIPPRSLASAPSAGGVLTEPVQSEEEIFAETFSRKA